MKQLFLLLTVSLFLFTSCETNPGVTKAFAKYSLRKDVTSITVPGWLIGLGATFGDLSDEESDLLSCIDKVKILSVENEELNNRIDLHTEFFEEINKNNDYEELLTVRDKNENVTIFGKMSEEVITEIVVLVGGDDNAIIYIQGEIKPEMINNALDLSNPEQFLSMKF